LNDLLSSDTMVYGYPETLIIAHQLAKLSRLDVLSIRTALGHAMGLKFVDAPDIRSSLFTPVSTG
jgi:NurA-like 5'-3' nuclease